MTRNEADHYPSDATGSSSDFDIDIVSLPDTTGLVTVPTPYEVEEPVSDVERSTDVCFSLSGSDLKLTIYVGIRAR